MNSITFAARAKGPVALLKRARSITHRYGFSPAKMDQALHLFARILKRFNCGASLPLTAVTLERDPGTVAKYLDQDIEFAIHGYTHVDYSQLTPEEQLAHLRRAREIFAAAGIQAPGFRSPYLRRDPHLYAAVEAAGFSYVSNQPVMWDALDADALTPSGYACYQRAVDFYVPWLASERLSVPRLYNNLVEVPVSLPDDEILLDRLAGEANGLVAEVWQHILAESYQRGELFTVQLHPERILLCEEALRAVLERARSLSPGVWIARLAEIADWWRSRAEATYQVTKATDGSFRLTVNGPPGTAILARCVTVEAAAEPWTDGYRRVLSDDFVFQADQLPFIGLSPGAPSALVRFLREQGYLVQTGADARSCAFYLDRTAFAPEDERPLLSQVEGGTGPLLRLARWPNGAQSALSVTGDLDALTFWDYTLRFLGH